MTDLPGRFVTTRWSVIAAAGHQDAPQGAAALATLCEAYWFPVYAYVRHTGKSIEDAQDLTQAFFTRLIEKNDVRAADPARGRFRTFLLASVRHFLANQHHAAVALKRGGGARHVSIEFSDGERCYAHDPGHDETPERVFERRWALAVVHVAMTRLERSCAGAGRNLLFERLRPCLAGSEPGSYAALAEELGMTEGALRVALHRLRRTLREALRSIIAETVERPEDVDDELRFLLAAISG